ncbi:MAG TPA: hypothetical protein VLE54_05225, partial [Thermoanaerobaculia bacterium]|nr:hypothetical protein [Thermoanaerobaculia bacterium]
SRARRSIRRAALTSCVVGFLCAAVAAASVEVYPGPGGVAYQSSLYQVEVFNGSSWIPAYVYGFSRKSVCHWHTNTYPTVNFLTFGTTGAVDVRVTKIGVPITSIDVSPHSKHIAVQLTGGQAVLTLNQNNKVWITLNGDDADPLFVFADPPKPQIPAGATYVGPGVVNVGGEGHYKPSNNQIIYLDGGAWVRGNVDLRGTSGVQIIGPGVLAGDSFLGEYVNTLPFDQQLDFAMIRGDWFSGDGASVRGITIVDSPFYNFFSGATKVSGVKLLSPWFFSTDGFQGVSHVDQSFAFVGDNVFATAAAGNQNDNVTVTSSFAGTSNNSVFTGGSLGNPPTNRYSALADDIDIKTYDNDEGLTVPLAAAFQIWVDNSDPTWGYSNQTYQNIRIEGNVGEGLMEVKNFLYIFGPAPNPPLGNSYNLVFKNITLEGTQKYRSEIKGWDATNTFHRVVLENFRINGTLVTEANLADYFDVNAYVSDLRFTSGTSFYTLSPCRVLDTRDPAGPVGGPALAAGVDRFFALFGRCGVPRGALAVSANVTITQPTTPGHVTVYPAGTAIPLASTLNFRAGQTRANNAILPVGPSGEIAARSGQPSGTVQFILDVNGYFQ